MVYNSNYAAAVRILVAPGDLDTTGSHSPTVAVSCVATGTPHPHITWQRNNYPLTNNSFQLIQEEVVMKNGLEVVVGTLSICPLQAEGGGHYTCRVQNQYSSAEAGFSVATSGEPGLMLHALSDTEFIFWHMQLL